ncbi:hypothetical protein D9M71_549500 [compost metagenome]
MLSISSKDEIVVEKSANEVAIKLGGFPDFSCLYRGYWLRDNSKSIASNPVVATNGIAIESWLVG